MQGQCQSPPTLNIPPGIMQLLHTNRVPTDVQKRDIINLIQVQDALRSDVELERERLLRALERTAQTLVEVSDMISDLQATLSPIKRMPDEILALIFEHSLPVRPPNEPFTFHCPTRNFGPVQAGLVCSSWRRIAHASPRLWCNVDLHFYESKQILTKIFPRLLSGIDRSGSLPLNLTLLFDIWSGSDGIDDVLNTIALHSSRWRTIYIHIEQTEPGILPRLSCMFAQPFIGLLTLEISQLPAIGFRHDPGEPITFDFRKSPLSSLSLYLQELSAKNIFLPYDHLTRLSLDLDPPDNSTSSLSELLNALHRCHSLRECTLFLHADRELTPLPQVRLEHLQTLHIQIQQAFGAGNQLDDLLNVVYFPSLSSLDIAYRTPSASPIAFPEQFNPFLRRHTSNLRRFVFSASSSTFNTHDFLRIIEGISSITELDVDLHYSHSIIPLVEAFTPVLHEGRFSCLLPRLQALDLRWNTRNALSCIAEMVEMRCALAGSLHGIAQLKRITCTQIRGTNSTPSFNILCQSDQLRLAKFRDQGLTVTFPVSSNYIRSI